METVLTLTKGTGTEFRFSAEWRKPMSSNGYGRIPGGHGAGIFSGDLADPVPTV